MLEKILERNVAPELKDFNPNSSFNVMSLQLRHPKAARRGRLPSAVERLKNQVHGEIPYKNMSFKVMSF